MSEWRELPKGDIVAFAEAVKAEDDIEVETVYGGWTKWRPDTGWSKSWTTRARSKPKTRQVQLWGFLSPYGHLVSYDQVSAGYRSATQGKWPRVPSKDEIVEVEG